LRRIDRDTLHGFIITPTRSPRQLGKVFYSPRLMALVARQAVPPLRGYLRYSSAPVPTQ
jgi:hypothetical protein